MATYETFITPSMATNFLNKNEHNRKLSVRRAGFLAESMVRGEWQFNGDAIRISTTGRLLDGQHRLKAIELCGIGQRVVLVTELNDESFTTIDIGHARDASQMLAISGETNTAALAAAAKMHLSYKKTGRPIHGNPDKKATPTQVVLFCKQDQAIKKSATFSTSNKWVRKYFSPSIAAFCHYEFGLVNPEVRDMFFTEITSGEFSYHDSPIRIIRDMIIEDRGGHSRMDRSRKLAMIFKAFNLFSKGKSAKMIRLSKDQDEWYLL